MTNGKKRIHITISQEYFDKVEQISLRYGITTNSFISFIVGQWVDNNYDVNEKMSQKVDEMLPDLDSVFDNPQLMDMVKEILNSDEDFKNAIKNKK